MGALWVVFALRALDEAVEQYRAARATGLDEVAAARLVADAALRVDPPTP